MFCIRIQKEKLAATCTVETNEMLQLSDLNLYNKVTLKHLPFVFGFSLLSVAENWKCWVFCWEYFHTIDNKGLRLKASFLPFSDQSITHRCFSTLWCEISRSFYCFSSHSLSICSRAWKICMKWENCFGSSLRKRDGYDDYKTVYV